MKTAFIPAKPHEITQKYAILPTHDVPALHRWHELQSAGQDSRCPKTEEGLEYGQG